MKNLSRCILALTIFSAFINCKPNLKVPVPDKGGIDPAKYVAVGNSITAGFADGALYYDGQMVSFPYLLAQQLKLVGGGEFTQPLMPIGSVGIGGSLNAKYIMADKLDCKGITALGPVTAASFGDLNQFVAGSAGPGPFNNMGVPGAKVINIVDPRYGDPSSTTGFNPFFTRMLSPAEYSASILIQATKQNPTFFSVFIGNNDVLQFAAGGGSSNSITPVSGAPGTGFDGSFDMIISALTASGATGAVANIPDITSLPYFTTVPFNGLSLDAAEAAALNAVYGGQITFSAGANAFVILDPDAANGRRKMKSNEFALLTIPQDSLKCAGWGGAKPLGSQYILTESEILKIREAIQGYNLKVKTVAENKGLAFVDVNSLMAKIKTGISYNGIAIGTTFGSGGAFSLDGVHLTPRGNALLCNEFIKAINSTYGASIPQVDVSKYPGVIFP